MRITVTISLLVALSAQAYAEESTPADPITQAANRASSQGLVSYELQDYERAIWGFEVSFQIRQSPDLLYAAGQAERLSGDCASAMHYYRRYLQTKPEAAKERAARINYALCVDALRSTPAGTGMPMRRTVAFQVRDLPDRSFRDFLASDSWGRALLTGSFAGLAVGASYVGGYLADEAQPQRKLGFGLTGLAVGSAMFAGTLYRYMDWGEQRQMRLSFQPISNGMAVTYGGSLGLIE